MWGRRVDGDETSECGYIRAPCQCHRRNSGTGGSQPHGARAQQPWTGVGEGRRTEAPQGLGTLHFSPGGLSWLPPLPHRPRTGPLLAHRAGGAKYIGRSRWQLPAPLTPAPQLDWVQPSSEGKTQRQGGADLTPKAAVLRHSHPPPHTLPAPGKARVWKHIF